MTVHVQHGSSPTWFICNSEENCQCGNGHADGIVCDNETLTSAV